MKAHTSHFLRFTGFAIGAVLAVGWVLSGRMPESQAQAPARLSIASQPTTELGVSPAGPRFLATRRLLPGGRPARGTLTVSNFGGRARRFRMRVRSPQRDLDRVVRLQVRAGQRLVFDGPLAELRSWTRRSLRVLAGRPQELDFRVWVPMSVESGYEGRSVELELDWKKVSG
jgi:hypothetical protein